MTSNKEMGLMEYAALKKINQQNEDAAKRYADKELRKLRKAV